MKSMKSVLLLAVLSVMLCMIAGCGGSKDPLKGSWAYNHEPEKEILKIKGSHAEYKGEKYEYSSDDTFIYLKKDGNEQKLRYVITEDGVNLYEPAVYEYQGEGTPNGIIGDWKCGLWEYIFSEDGRFQEDYFTGMYKSDENTITLVYDRVYGQEDSFDDTLIYYILDNNKLYVEYPWPLVKTSAGK